MFTFVSLNTFSSMNYSVLFKCSNPFFLAGSGGPVYRGNSDARLGKENENESRPYKQLVVFTFL